MAPSFPLLRLPYELRMQIWEMTVEARTVAIRVAYEGPTKSDPCLRSSTPAPAVLSVCQESRNHGLYQKVFFERAGSPSAGVRYIWLNQEIDVLDISEEALERFRPFAAMIHRLRMERPYYHFFYDWEGDELEYFVNLKEIHIVCQDGLRAWRDALEDHQWPCGEENVFFIDPVENDRIYRGSEGLDRATRDYK
ncbi:hypothetical protein IQ07DRAFT_241482 [Pyrenochaeta sp. DS3sAY3a]|nr:hypothetical protein IQ07DRAFT_241482 [Pyrenochaeta sp. DS3sAY3a]